nr:DUF305 domain-containing protein [Agaricicola taiwanensis]
MATQPSHTAHAVSDAGTETPSTAAYRTAHDDMMEAMDLSYTGDADTDFMRGMIPHHEGAIAMAKVVQRYGQDPQIRGLADSIIAAQEAEIKEMKEWLAERGGHQGGH